MCGIAGVYNYNEAPAVEKQHLAKMSDAMLSRGPDGEGFWFAADGKVGLTHRRLSIIDLSDAGAQPMISEDGRTVIVFNGEIYNHKVLRQELQKKGHRFRSSSDTEVILKLYQNFGADFVKYLRGMYAIAIWDENKRRLVMARDPFGIKPLYYSDNGASVQFASQVKSLLAGQQVDTSMDPAGQVGFFLWGHIPEPYTLYRQIRSMPPGSLFVIEQGRTPVISIYSRPLDVLRNLDSVDLDQGLIREAVIDSVQHHLEADVPVGVFLSAGIDSSAICALAMEINCSNPLHTVTLGFEEYKGTGNDEVPMAVDTAKKYGVRHDVKWVAKRDFSSSLEHLLSSMDQPTVDGVNTYFVSKVTSESGLKVALSGVGGDEFFGGYPSFRQVPRLAKSLAHVPAFLGQGFRLISYPVLRRYTSPKYAGIFEYGGSYSGGYLLRRSLFMPWELPELLDPEVVREGWRELHTMSRLNECIDGQPNQHCKIMALEIEWYMQSRLLRDSDWAGMAHSLEIRTPLVDIQLFSKLAPMMAGVQVDKLPAKKDLAATPALPLGSSIVDRPKSGFGIPVQDWLLDAGGADPGQRGLRGWAKFVAKEFGFSGMVN